MIISLEEETLTSLFKNDYKIYCKNVPRLLPRLSSWQKYSVNIMPLPLIKTLQTEKRTIQNITAFIVTIYFKSLLLPSILN